MEKGIPHTGYRVRNLEAAAVVQVRRSDRDVTPGAGMVPTKSKKSWCSE